MRVLLLSSTLLVALAAPVYGQENDTSAPCAHYGGHIDVEGKLGSQRDIGEASAFVPIACDQDTLLFSDVRFKRDNIDNQEVNLGLGVRELKQSGVLGFYAFIDRKKSGITDKYHTQTTIGGEWLTENWEVRGNTYIPLTDTVEVGAVSTSAPYLAGSGIFITETGQIIREAPLYGGDVEAGIKIPDTKFWLHAGAFSFTGDDAPTLTGARARASYQITENLALTAEGQYDDERGRQGWVGARITLPFGGPAQKPDELKARMTASPVRDVDIVTQASTVSGGEAPRAIPVINSDSGQVQRIIYIDNTSAGGGDGSKEHPFNTLAAAQTALADYDIVYIHTGVGTTGMNTGLNISKNNVSVIGAGSAFVYDGSKFSSSTDTNPDGTVLIAAGTAPTLTNSTNANINGDGIRISGQNTTISGLNVTNAYRHGIHALADNANIGDVTLTNVHMNSNGVGTASRGFFAYALTGGDIGDITLTDVQANQNNGSTGIYIQSFDPGASINSVSITNATANNNTAGGRGIYIEGNGGSVGDITLDNITTNGNDSQGISLRASNSGGGGTLGDIVVNNVTANSNANIGFHVLSTGVSSTIDSVTVDEIVASNNTTTSGRGILMQATAGGTMTAVDLSNLTTNSNGAQGVYIQATTASGNRGKISNLTIENVTSATNAHSGLTIETTGAGSEITTAAVRHVSSTGNTTANGRGMLVSAATSASINTLTLEDITVTNNASTGMTVQASGGGNISTVNLTDATATGNAAQGIYILAAISGVGSTIGSAVLNDIVATSNQNTGLFIQANGLGSSITSAQVTNATLQNNTGATGYGLYVTTSNDATIGNAAIDDILSSGNDQYGAYISATSNGNINGSMQNSTITANKLDGIFLNDDSTTGTFGFDLGGGGASTGHNRLYGNGTSNTALYRDLRLDFDGSVTPGFARFNWWGQAGGPLASQIQSQTLGATPPAANSGTVNSSGFLTTDPGP